MKVSFLVTYYNQKEYIADSLNSILNIKKSFDWEIIVGDDGSTDGTIECVQNYIEKYPDYISLYVMPREKNKRYDNVKRASANRLNLLEHATGDLFCILDGDDYYCNNDFVKEAIDIFESNDNVTVVSFGFKYVRKNITKNIRTVASKLNPGIVDKKKYLDLCYVHAGACVLRCKWNKERMNYIKSIGYFDDNDIVINSLNYGEMYSVDKVIYAYRQTDSGIYTGMNKVEQAVLNVQGFDIDVKLIDKRYKYNLLQRYAGSILTMYFFREKLVEILDKDKYERYIKECEEIKDSLTYQIFAYDSLRIDEKRNVDKIIKMLKKNNLMRYFRVKLRCLVKGTKL